MSRFAFINRPGTRAFCRFAIGRLCCPKAVRGEKGVGAEPGSLWNGCAFFNPLAHSRCELFVGQRRF